MNPSLRQRIENGIQKLREGHADDWPDTEWALGPHVAIFSSDECGGEGASALDVEQHGKVFDLGVATLKEAAPIIEEIVEFAPRVLSGECDSPLYSWSLPDFELLLMIAQEDREFPVEALLRANGVGGFGAIPTA